MPGEAAGVRELDKRLVDRDDGVCASGCGPREGPPLRRVENDDAHPLVTPSERGNRSRDPLPHDERIDDDSNQRGVGYLPRRIRHRA